MLLQAVLTPVPAFTGLGARPPLLTAIAALLIVCVLIAIAQRSLRHDPRAWFLLSGMILAAIPLAVTLPHDGLLMPASIGWCWVDCTAACFRSRA